MNIAKYEKDRYNEYRYRVSAYYGGQIVNIYDISAKAGVSIATVSRVLNNNPHVSEETRKRVMAVIDESRYVPNAFARGLGLNTMKTIGLLCPDASDPYLAQALDYLEADFRAHGYDCLLACTGREPEARKEGVLRMISRHVDSMVLMGSSFIEDKEEDNQYLREAADSVPIVLLNGHYQADGIYCVFCDDEKAMYDATNYLIEQGKKKILYLHHSLNNSGKRKLNGYRRALNENSIDLDERMILLVDKDRHTIPHVCMLLKELANRGLKFDAVIASEDILAVAAIKYAAEMGIAIPEDLALIGYNNSIMCLCTNPELSSVDNKLLTICQKIVQTVIDVLNGQKTETALAFEAELILRETTAE